jgi:lipoate-protein ligase B
MKRLNLGLIDYKEAYEIQKDLVKKVRDRSEEETLIICSHPSVVTLGKKSTPSDLVGWEGPTYEIERGGQATYHGPGQVVMYPILNLKVRGQNIAGYLEAMEQSMIEVLGAYGLPATGNTERGIPDFTGVWLKLNPPKKVASIGVAIQRWITYHGLALNLYHDDQAFRGINPCGFSTDTMTDLETILQKRLKRSDFEEQLSSSLILAFSKLLT